MLILLGGGALGHEGAMLINEISALIRRDTELAFPPLFAV